MAVSMVKNSFLAEVKTTENIRILIVLLSHLSWPRTRGSRYQYNGSLKISL